MRDLYSIPTTVCATLGWVCCASLHAMTGSKEHITPYRLPPLAQDLSYSAACSYTSTWTSCRLGSFASGGGVLAYPVLELHEYTVTAGTKFMVLQANIQRRINLNIMCPVASPEVLMDQNCDGKEADVQSCRVTLFVMLYGRLKEGPNVCAEAKTVITQGRTS